MLLQRKCALDFEAIMVADQERRYVYTLSVPIVCHHKRINILKLLRVNRDHHCSAEGLNVLCLLYEVARPSVNHNYQMVTVPSIFDMFKVLCRKGSAAISVVDRVMDLSLDSVSISKVSKVPQTGLY